jgi:CBS domain-containing protein
LEITSLCAADICRTDVVTADEHTSLYEIAKLMREHHIGDVVITASGDSRKKPIGIVTDRDIVVHGIACDIDLGEVCAGDLSARNLVTVRPEAGVSEIVSTMNVHAVRRVIVDGGTKFNGIITFDDILWALSQVVNNLSAVTERQIQRETESEVQLTT